MSESTEFDQRVSFHFLFLSLQYSMLWHYFENTDLDYFILNEQKKWQVFIMLP